MNRSINLPVDILTDPKCIDAGPDATLLWIKSLLYAQKHNTGADISPNAIDLFGLGMQQQTVEQACAMCVLCGLWDDDDAVFSIRDWDKYATTPDQGGANEAGND